VRAAGRGDRPAALLALAVRGLPADQTAWGQAMLVECDQVPGPRARWRFCLGCTRVVTAMRLRAPLRPESGRGAPVLRAGLLGLAAASLLLAVFGAVRYPGLPAAPDAWVTGGVLIVALAAYAFGARTLLPGAAPSAARARRRGLLAGPAVGAAWLAVLAPAGLKSWVLVALVIAMACPAALAALTARAGGDLRTATGAALMSGLVGGLLVFVGRMTATYLADARPYDPQLIRDFQHRGAHDLAAYAINDRLQAVVLLLVVVPTVSLALGALAGRTTAAKTA
jgi:hypothetical protein